MGKQIAKSLPTNKVAIVCKSVEAVVNKVKILAGQLGGISSLKALVDALAD
jgi:hypothetical protein